MNCCPRRRIRVDTLVSYATMTHLNTKAVKGKHIVAPVGPREGTNALVCKIINFVKYEEPF